MVKEINLDNFLHSKETALIGRDNGENIFKQLAQRQLDFKTLEAQYDKIIIQIPERIVSINKSYFLGLFETVVERLGKEQFFAKYDFRTTQHIKEKIKRHVDAALLDASQGDILNG